MRPSGRGMEAIAMSFTPVDYDPYDFANRRHIGPSPAEMDDMLKAVGLPVWMS